MHDEPDHSRRGVHRGEVAHAVARGPAGRCTGALIQWSVLRERVPLRAFPEVESTESAHLEDRRGARAEVRAEVALGVEAEPGLQVLVRMLIAHVEGEVGRRPEPVCGVA